RWRVDQHLSFTLENFTAPARRFRVRRGKWHGVSIATRRERRRSFKCVQGCFDQRAAGRVTQASVDRVDRWRATDTQGSFQQGELAAEKISRAVDNGNDDQPLTATSRTKKARHCRAFFYGLVIFSAKIP